MNHHGIPSNKMTVIGMGPNFPEFPNDSPENRAKNRRAEFQVMNSSTASPLQSRILNVISSYAGDLNNEQKIKKAYSPGFIIEQHGRAMKKYDEFKEFFDHKYEILQRILAPEEE